MKELRAALREAKADLLVKDARDAEERGEGNVVPAFILAHRRRPNEDEARRLALASGKSVTDSGGTIRTPATAPVVRA
jgi:hypothetical protein